MSSNEVTEQTAPARVQRVVDGYDQLLRMLPPARSASIFESSVTMAQLRVLMLLSARPESRMSQLAGALHLSLSTVSGLVDRLVENGLAARHTDDADRRQVLVSLTQEGATFLDLFSELGKETLRDLLTQLSDTELDEVAEAMDILIRAAERAYDKEHK
jgi:DNA-binding MarR family transcriptional regulator